MSQLYKWRLSKTIVALLALAVLGFVGAPLFGFQTIDLRKSRAQNYYEHGVKLAKQHEYCESRHRTAKFA